MFNAITSLEFAKFIIFAIQENINGIYHLGASETISKASFLHKVKNQFDLINININDVQNLITDNTVISIRNDIHYIRKSYDEMLKELKLWMCDNKDVYNHYSFI
jgi:dTDP-4-dehydrorhamnose reductase